jgi:phosphatidylglycerol:prolipoprotein diacylglycerol transferase
MKNELFKIGPFTMYGYGLMIGIGIMAAYLTAEYRAKKLHLDADKVFALCIWCVVGGFLSAKVLFYLTQIKSIIADPSLLLELSDGFVVYGGIIGGILTGYLYCKIRKLEFIKYFDLIMPSIALAQGFGRIGCFLAGCCYGRETSSIFGITFTDSSFAPNHISLIPTQLISSGLDFLLFFFLLIVEKRKKADGQVAGFYLICYSVGRFILEFFRGDLGRGTVGTLSTSQFISIFLLIAGVFLVWFTGYKKKKQEII